MNVYETALLMATIISLHVLYWIQRAVAINQARVDGAAWIGHIDTDELLYPASSPTFSMHGLLEEVSSEV